MAWAKYQKSFDFKQNFLSKCPAFYIFSKTLKSQKIKIYIFGIQVFNKTSCQFHRRSLTNIPFSQAIGFPIHDTLPEPPSVKCFPLFLFVFIVFFFLHGMPTENVLHIEQLTTSQPPCSLFTFSVPRPPRTFSSMKGTRKTFP